MEDFYRDVVGIPGYRVGRDGSVLSCRNTSQGMTSNWKALKGSVWGVGCYRMMTLRLGGKMIRRFLHHLVLEAFVGPRPLGMCGCHKNDNPDDNRLDNLRWDYPSENFADRDRNGGTARGSRQGLSKLTEQDVEAMRNMAAAGTSSRAISRLFHVNESNVGHIVSGRTWRHAGGPLTKPSSRRRPRTASGRFVVEVS